MHTLFILQTLSTDNVNDPSITTVAIFICFNLIATKEARYSLLTFGQSWVG